MLKLYPIALAAWLAGPAVSMAAQTQTPPPAQPAPPAAQAQPQTQPQAPRPGTVSELAPRTVCGLPIPEPARQPPPNSTPLVYLVVPCFQKQGGTSAIDPAT